MSYPPWKLAGDKDKQNRAWKRTKNHKLFPPRSFFFARLVKKMTRRIGRTFISEIIDLKQQRGGNKIMSKLRFLCAPPNFSPRRAALHAVQIGVTVLSSAVAAESHGCLPVRPSCRFVCAAAKPTVYGSVLSCLLFFLTVDSKTGLIMLEILLSSAPRHHFFSSPLLHSPAPSSLLFLF